MSSGAEPTAPPRSARSQRTIIAAAILIFAAVSAYLALVIVTRVDSIFFPGNQITLPSAFGVAPGIDAGGNSGSTQPINILVMGLDRRAREGNIPTRTDSLFVMRIDPKTHSTGIVGIPRDLLVNIPGKNGGTYQDRINTVYVAGELGKYPGGGVALLEQVLAADPFNIKIDHYVIIDLKGFESVINDLGGIDVNVPTELYDPYYSETELPGDYFPVDFKPGLQHMDGKHALAYARVRFNSDDLDRIQRQQRVIFAAVEKAKSLNVLSSPAHATDLWDKYKGAIQTDISDTLIPGYAVLATQVQNQLHAVSLGPATAPYTTPQGAEVLVGSPDRIHQIMESVFSPGPTSGTPQATVTPEPVMVQVQNGTNTNGLATQVLAFIAGKGYPQNELNATNAFDGAQHAKTEILDVKGTNRRNAYLLANWLQIPPDRVRDATAREKTALASDTAQIVVIVGSDLNVSRLLESPTTSVPGG
ncbi:MAG TPA: LCP family protein [Dehalococcoidia bacterium]|nr:LCP family protein [Dehalococcoidia bacterium]